MASREELYQAIRNADAAGDTEAVRKLGAYLQAMPAAPAPVVNKYNPVDEMSTTERVLAGIGMGMNDMYMGAKQRLGLASQNEIDDKKSIDANLKATTSGKVGDIGGKIAVSLPAAIVPGANTYLGGAALGGLMGTMEPTAQDESVLKNAAIGAVGGAAGTAVGRLLGAGYRTAKAAIEPFYAAGKQRIVGRALNEAAGSAAPQAQKNLLAAAEPFIGPNPQGVTQTTMGELVPGSLPTVGQAAGNPGIAALERSAVATNPDVTNMLSQRMAQQNAARVGAVERLAGRDGARDFAAANRDATAEQLYGTAYQKGLPSLTPAQQANVAAFQQRVPADVLNEAKRLAQISGAPMTDATSLQGMHWTKKALDGLIAKESGPGGNPSMLRAYVGLKNDMMQGMGNLSPDYAAASRVFADMSRPVNQMDVAGALLDKSVNPLSGNLQPSSFARALTDRTAQKATGFNGATLENTMDPAQLNVLRGVLEDVQRSNAAQNVGRGVGSDTVQKLAYSNMLAQSGVPNFMRQLAPAQVVGNLLTRGADVAYGRANRDLSAQLANTMLAPQDAAAAMEAASGYSNDNALLQLLRSPATQLLSTRAAIQSNQR
jgi:hypothetical protein